MKKYILNPSESKSSVQEYIHTLDDMAYSIQNLQWEIQPVQQQLLAQAGENIAAVIELLKQILTTPERIVIKYDQ